MSVARSAAEVLRDHVVLEVEAIDRMYLNVYVPHLQSVGAVVGYLRVHRGQRFASTTAVTPMTEAFVRNIGTARQARGGPDACWSPTDTPKRSAHRLPWSGADTPATPCSSIPWWRHPHPADAHAAP